MSSVACFYSCDQCDGCTDPLYSEYNPFNEAAEGYCLTAISLGCTYADAENFNAGANVDDGSCEFAAGGDCPGDLNDDGSIERRTCCNSFLYSDTLANKKKLTDSKKGKHTSVSLFLARNLTRVALEM